LDSIIFGNGMKCEKNVNSVIAFDFRIQSNIWLNSRISTKKRIDYFLNHQNAFIHKDNDDKLLNVTEIFQGLFFVSNRTQSNTFNGNFLWIRFHLIAECNRVQSIRFDWIRWFRTFDFFRVVTSVLYGTEKTRNSVDVATIKDLLYKEMTFVVFLIEVNVICHFHWNPSSFLS